jgi:dihydrofolate synthase/folylpolyglutamate synthase
MHAGVPRAHEGLPHASFVVTERPSRIGSPLRLSVTTPRATYRQLEALKPGYQAANIACAVVLCENYLDRALDADALRASVFACPTPGRFDVVRTDPVALIDACHNPQSVETFLTAVRAISPVVADRPALLAAVLADKDVEGIVALLAGEFPRVYVTQTSSPRALPASELATIFRAAGAKVAAVFENVDAAVKGLCEVSYIACGSITLAGEVAGMLG